MVCCTGELLYYRILCAAADVCLPLEQPNTTTIIHKHEPGGILLPGRGSDRERERPGGRPLHRGGGCPPSTLVVGHPAALAEAGSNADVIRKPHRCASTNVRINTFTRHGGGVAALACYSAGCSFVARSVCL